jgi:hypothetical protein
MTMPFGLEALAHRLRVGAARGAQIALRRAIVEPEARRIAGAAGRLGVAHQRDMAALAQRGPRPRIPRRAPGRGRRERRPGREPCEARIGTWERTKLLEPAENQPSRTFCRWWPDGLWQQPARTSLVDPKPSLRQNARSAKDGAEGTRNRKYPFRYNELKFCIADGSAAPHK